MKTIACVVVLGLALGACTYKSETTVQRPAPTSTSSTTYVTPDSSSPTGTSSTTVTRTN